MKKIFIPLIVPIILGFGLSINVNAQENQISSLTPNNSKSASKGGNSSDNTSTNSFAQEKSNKELKGDKYSFNYSFDKAINTYSRAKLLSVEGQRKLALSYHNMGKNAESEVAYSKLMTTQDGILPEDYYNYSMVLKSNGKYDESNKWMDKFSDLKPFDLRAKDYNTNKGTFANLSKDNGKFKIQHLDFNTDADDFGTSFYKDKIVFASTRAISKMIVKKYNWNGKPFFDIYVSKVDKGQLKTPDNFNKKMNGRLHEGPASFNKEGTFMAFTRNNYDTKRKDKVVNLQIFFSNFKDSTWTEPEPFILNNIDYSVGQPCLSSDGNTMYFTSNMPGGYGGADIYRITKDAKGVWGKAENLGDKINTEGDEMFPFYEETNGVLFFSSNGRFGLGGQDIFICPAKGSGFGTAVNAGSPLNTQYDDFAAIIDGKMSKGYFSSNRPDGSGGDDIYSFELLDASDIGKKIVGIAENIDGVPIPGTFITLLDDNGNAIDTITTKNDAAFTFYIESNKNFVLTGRKENYTDGDTLANSFGKDYIIKADVILLTKKEFVAQAIKIDADLGVILELKNIYFNLDKYNIRPDAAAELDKIAAIMNEYPDMIVQLSSYCDCRESKKYNQLLSDKRANASASYIKKKITKPERISGKGYGKSNILNSCTCDGDQVSDCSEEEHQINRRTEFKIVKK